MMNNLNCYFFNSSHCNDLNQNFPADIKPFVEFLRSIREVHTVCMKEELDLSFVYKEAIEKFEMNRKL